MATLRQAKMFRTEEARIISSLRRAAGILLSVSCIFVADGAKHTYYLPTYEVPARLADKGVHSIIDSLNPVLRSSEICNGRLRVREFYAMAPEEAYKIFEAMANIHACPERLRLIPASTEEKKDEEEAIKIEEETQERKARFSFEAINSEQDEKVEFWYTSKTPSGIMCRVLNDRQVEYEGKP